MRAESTACTLAGTVALVDRSHQPVGAALALEVSRLDQRLHDLLDEERVAAGALADQLGQPVERGIGAEQVAEHLLDRLGPERRQGELAVVGLRHPRRAGTRAGS